MRLRYIERADFRKSEQTNFVEVQRRQKLELGAKDVVMLISTKGNQLVFVHGFDQYQNGVTRQILRSERLRLTSGTWNPLMLANYAESVGIKIDGIKRFEEHYKALAERA